MTASTVAPCVARQPHRRQRVRGLARLGDPQHERAGRRRSARGSGTPRRSRRRRGPAPTARSRCGRPGPRGRRCRRPRRRSARPRAAGRRSSTPLASASAVARRRASVSRDRVGLLVDLLEHERLEPVLLARVLSHSTRSRAGACGRPSAPAICTRSGRRADDLAVGERRDLPRVRQERRDRGRDELLTVTESDHQRALAPDADQRVGLVVAHRDQRVVTGRARPVTCGPHRPGRPRSSARSGERRPRRRCLT